MDFVAPDKKIIAWARPDLGVTENGLNACGRGGRYPRLRHLSAQQCEQLDRMNARRRDFL